MNDKNQAAIDHVASVSKNPHAAMIVKWLITGCDIEFYDDEYKIWVSVGGNPTWYDDIKYREVEQKTAMEIMMQNKPSIYEAFVERLNKDFILTKRQQWPTPLVERIAAIDIKAAEWIVDRWDDLLEEKYVTENNYSRDSDKLMYMFCWENTTQGVQYWNNIDNKLGE